MHLLLTDRLTCPRCGPAFGLILLADQLADRRVRSGILGCPNCRDSFRIDDGFADLRAPPRGPLLEGHAGHIERPAQDDIERVVALLGIHRGPGTVATLGVAAPYAAPLAEVVEDIMVAAVDPDTKSWPSHPGVSYMVSSPGLPFFDRTLRGIIVDGALGPGMLFEACRCTAPMSRVVVLRASLDAPTVIEQAGLSVLAAEDETVVAARG